MSHKLLKAILFSQVMLVCSSVLCQTNANTNPAGEKEMILQAAQATHSGIPHLPLSKIPIKNFERAYAEIVAEQTDPAVLSKLQCLLFNQVKGAKSHQASSVIVEAITTTIRSNADCASEAIAALPKLEIDKTYKTQVLAEVIRETSRTDIIRSAACMALAKVGSLDNQTKEVLKNVLTSTHASAELQQAAAFAYLKENDNLTAVKDLFSSKIEAMSAVLPNVAVNLYQEAQQHRQQRLYAGLTNLQN